MKVIISRSYFGPNYHSQGPAAYLLIDSGNLFTSSPERFNAKFQHRLTETLRSVAWDGLPITPIHKGGPALPVSVKSRIGMLVESVIRWLLESSGGSLISVEYQQDCHAGQIEMVLECSDAEVGRRAGVLAVELLSGLIESPEDLAGADEAKLKFLKGAEALRRFAAPRRPTLAETAILAAAAERDIPAIRLDRWPFVDEEKEAPSAQLGLLQLGQGVFQKRIRGTATSAVPSKIYELLDDRHASHKALLKADIPVPARNLEFVNVNSLRRALRNARRVGYPLVIKPRRRTVGVGVAVNLNDEEAVMAAYHTVSCHTRQVVVEKYISGDTFRFLVIAGEVIAACKRPRAGTKADNVEGGGASVSTIDEIALDRIAPELKATAVRAAACFHLGVAGVDVVTSDISCGLTSSGGAVICVDPMPDLGFHLCNGECIPLTAARRFLAYLFPPGTNTRIATFAVTGTNGKTTTCRMLAAILHAEGKKVGLACTDGIYIDGVLKQKGRYSGIAGALQVFINPDVDAAVLETSRGTLVMKGLAFSECDLSACTNVAADHIGDEGVESNDRMAEVKRVVLQKARAGVVVNGDDILCLNMVPHVNAREICLITFDRGKPEVRTHLASGRPVVTVMAGGKRHWITLLQADRQTPIVAVEDIPATFGGKAPYNVANAMFAVALSLGYGIKHEKIKRALVSVTSSISDTPGRMNEYAKLPFRVILDFAHNAHAFAALADFAGRVEVEGRRSIVMFAPSNRREDDFLAIAEAVAGKFDAYIVRQGTKPSARAYGEVPDLLKKHLISLGVSEQSVRTIPDYGEAVTYALNCAAPGDLLVIASVGKYQLTWDRLETFRASLRSKESIATSG